MFKNQISNLSNFQGIQLETDISVITLTDNISHTYCFKIKWEKNNYSPLGTAQLIMPYSKEVESYWIKYSGAVIVHANLNSRQKSLTQAMMYNMPNTVSLNMKKFEEQQKEEEKDSKDKKVAIKKDKKTNKLHLKNDYYNYSFIGKVARFKQTGKTFIVYLEDLGWKFLQKVPKEFRDSFIAGQSLDDAFQAICEFMGVDFAYSIEDLGGYQFSADGYSVEKNGEVIEDVPSILKEWGAPDDEEEEDEEKTEEEKMADALKDGQPFEAPGLLEYKKQQKQANQSSNQSNTSLNSQVTNQTNNQSDNKLEEETNTTSDKITMYQQEFDDKIKDLFIGNTLYDSNISDPILNYGWITITPKVATTSTTNTNTQNQNNNQNTNQNNNQDNNQNNNQNNNQGANQ